MKTTPEALIALFGSRRGAALLDQALISGANFLVLLACARSLPAEQWGEFGFSYAAVLFCQGFQRAMVTIPMTAFSVQRGSWVSHSAAWAALNIRVAAVAAGIALGVAGISAQFDFTWAFNSALMAAGLCVPLFCMEFGRRAAIQAQQFSLLVMSAATYAIGATVILTILHGVGLKNRWLPVLAVSGGAALSYAVAVRGNVAPIVGKLDRSMHESEYIKFSIWASLGHLSFSGYNFGIQGLLGALAGPTALGAYHACRTLLQPVNTLMGALDSIDKPQAASAYAQNGRRGLFAVLRRSAILIAIFAGTYIATALSLDEWLLRAAYGERYIEQRNVLAMWCLVAGISAFAQPIEAGLYVIRCTRELFYARLLASVASIVCGALLIEVHGAVGALLATAVGYAIAAGCGFRLLRRQAE